jgi:hypothetical protein
MEVPVVFAVEVADDDPEELLPPSPLLPLPLLPLPPEEDPPEAGGAEDPLLLTSPDEPLLLALTSRWFDEVDGVKLPSAVSGEFEDWVDDPDSSADEEVDEEEEVALPSDEADWSSGASDEVPSSPSLAVVTSDGEDDESSCSAEAGLALSDVLLIQRGYWVGMEVDNDLDDKAEAALFHPSDIAAARCCLCCCLIPACSSRYRSVRGSMFEKRKRERARR